MPPISIMLPKSVIALDDSISQIAKFICLKTFSKAMF
jgi:hypothetical protein